jgi:hypothetical protein
MAATDNCGATRNVNCGGCNGSDVCAANQCRPSQCSSLAFANMTQVATINASGQQDALGAVSADGGSVINHRAAQCTQFTTLLIEQIGLNTVTIDLSANAAFMTTTRHNQEATFAMTGDALTFAAVTADQTGFIMATRTAKGSSTFAPVANAFADLAVTPPAIVAHPVLSQDGLAFYYVVRNHPTTSLDGLYESLRSSTAVPFPAPVKMGGDAQGFDAPVSISGDKMTFFMQTGFGMHVLRRNSLTKPFTNPNAPAAAPTVPGFRTRIVGNCGTLMGTCTGGCLNEQTCTFTP